MRYLLALLCAVSLSAANLLPNASFELGTHKGWSPYGTKDATRATTDFFSTDFAYDGTHCIKLEYSGSPRLWLSQPIIVRTNTPYVASVYLRESGAASYGPIFQVVNPYTAAVAVTSTVNPNNTGWTRYEVTWNSGSTNAFRVEISAASAGYPGVFLYADGVQMETGTVATAWAPMTNELAFSFNTTNIANAFVATNTAIEIPVHLYSAVAITNTIDWELIDFWGAIRKSGSLVVTQALGLTTTNIDVVLATNKLGHFRIVGLLRDTPDSRDEIALSVLPELRVLSDPTNGLFGAHFKGYPHWVTNAYKVGFRWSRSLSVDDYGNWEIAEPTDDNFVYFDANVTNAINAGLIPYVVLGGGAKRGSVPTFATNGTGDVILSQYTNFVANLVTHYSALGAHWYEIWNEPSMDGDVASAVYRDMLTNSYTLIHSLDADATVVALADFYTNYVDAVLSVGGASNFVDRYSTHIYTLASPGGNEEYADYQGLDAINSEEGSTRMSSYRTLPWEYVVGEHSPFSGTPPYDQVRMPRVSSLFQLYNWARTSGERIKQNFYYDARNDGGFNNLITYSVFDWDHTLSPMGASVAAAAMLADDAATTSKGYSLALGTGIYCEIFRVDDTDSLAVVWTTHTTNVYNLTTSLGAADFEVYDAMGNTNAYSAGVKFSYIAPVLIKGLAQATNVLGASLTAAASTDTTAPVIEWCSTPIGTYTTNRYRFSWWGHDDVGLMRWSSVSNALQFRWLLTGVDGTWSAWSHTNAATYAALPTTGNFRLQVKDPAQNTTEDEWNWPYAPSPPIPPTTSGGTLRLKEARAGSIGRP